MLRWRLALVGSLAAALAPLKSFGKTKGRGIRIQDKRGNANEAVVELFLGTAELETATVGGFTRSQKCVQVDGCAIYGEMNDRDVTRLSGCLGVICPFAAITIARDATDTQKLADALEAARRGAYAVGAEKVSGDATEGPMGGAYKTLEKARGAVGIFGLDDNVAAPKNPLDGLKAPELANPLETLRDWNPAPEAPAAAPAPLAEAAAAAQAAAEKAEAELASLRDGQSSSAWNPFAKSKNAIEVDVGPKPNFWEVEKLTAWKLAEAEARRKAEAVAEAEAAAARDSAIARAEEKATAARAAAEAAAEAARAETEAAEAARAEAEAKQKAEAEARKAAEASARAELDGPAPVVDTPPEDRDKLPPRLRARRAAEDLLREEDERRQKMAAEATRSSTPDEGRSRLEASFAASPDAAPAPTAPPPPSEDAQSEFEKFLANRKAGKSDADYWAARKAEEAPEEEDDFLKTIKYRPPE